MTFLNPLVLLGMVAAAIPLIIHLFNFRRPRRVDFSSLAFVRELQRSTMQRVRLKQWLLLLLRTLAIAMLVLSFARPTLTGGLASIMGGGGRTSVAIVFDNSASMELRGTRGSYLEEARGYARELAAQMDAGDELVLLTTANTEDPPRTFRTRSSAIEAIDAIEAGVRARPARLVLNEASAALASSENVNREIYLISDMQRSTLGDTVELSMPSDATLTLLPTSVRAHSNVAIESVRVASRIVEVGSPVRVEVTVRNYGADAIDDYGIGLYLGDERVAEAPVDLPPASAATASLVVTPQRNGWLGGRVEGEDDLFPRDNVRFLALHVPQTRRILLVHDAQENLSYVRLALGARESAGTAAFDVDEVPAASFANALSRLREYDAVLLLGAGSTSTGAVAALEQYVRNGGGLLIAPSSASEASDIDPVLEALGAGRVGGMVGRPGSGQGVAALAAVDAEHTIFEGVFDESLQRGDREVEQPRVFAAARYVPRSGAEQTLIRMTNGDPLLQEITHDRGTVLFLATAPVPSWSELPVSGLFVPLIYRALQYLSASEEVQGIQVVAGGEAELRYAATTGGRPIHIVGPLGEEFIPEQRAVPGAVLIRLGPEVDRIGLYTVHEGDRIISRFAANYDPAESDLTFASVGDLARALRDETGAHVRILSPDEVASNGMGVAVRAARSGIELWNVFLLLALCFLVSEMIVARRWRPEAVAS